MQRLIEKHQQQNGVGTGKLRLLFTPELITSFEKNFVPGMNYNSNNSVLLAKEFGVLATRTKQRLLPVRYNLGEMHTMVADKTHQDPVTKEVVVDSYKDVGPNNSGALSGYDPLLGTIFDFYVGGKGFQSLFGLGKYSMNRIKSIFNKGTGDITENFLKFTGGSGKPLSLAVPETLALKELYEMLEKSGVDMSKIGIEDINRALELRELQLLSSGKRFTYHQPLSSKMELLEDVDKGRKIGYIELNKPYLTNSKGFDNETWLNYSSSPRNKGLRVDMVENISLKNPKSYNKVYRGELERLTNSAIELAKQQGYEGVVSGEYLLSPEKTTRMYPKYKHKRVLDLKGKYIWLSGQQFGTVYMLEEPTYETVLKSKIFDPRIIGPDGKMHIDWRKGSSMFTSYSIPTMIGGYIYRENQ